MNIITCTAQSTNGGQRLLLIALTKKNINDMRKGKPFRLTPENNRVPEGWVIDLIYGEDVPSIVQHLRNKGLIDDKTEVEVHGKPTEQTILPVTFKDEKPRLDSGMSNN